MAISALLSTLIILVILGVMITVHELGHFWAARLVGVRVNEFALGMGPALWSRQGRETKFTLRLLPIGGYCAIEGEDTRSEDPRAFNNKPIPGRLLILVAGSLMNFLLGLVLVILIFLPNKVHVTNTVSALAGEFPAAGAYGLQVGDEILTVDGYRVYLNGDITILLDRKPAGPHDLTVRRGGQVVALRDLPLTRRDYTEDGQTLHRYGLSFGVQPATPLTNLKIAALNCIDFVRIVRLSLGDIIGGRASLNDVAGPVGMGGAVNDIVQDARQSVLDRILNILYLAALIAINLSVVNLLPLPALDGGRMVFLLVEAVRRKPVNPKYESWVHAAGLVFFLGLMVVVFFHDILRLLGKV